MENRGGAVVDIPHDSAVLDHLDNLLAYFQQSLEVGLLLLGRADHESTSHARTIRLVSNTQAGEDDTRFQVLLIGVARNAQIVLATRLDDW